MKPAAKLILIVICLILSAALPGCGMESASSSQKQSLAQEPLQWRSRGFVISEKEEEDKELNIQQFLPWTHEMVFDAEEGETRTALDCGVCGELIWWLNRVTDPEKAEELVLEIYDTITDECTIKRFSYEQLGLEESEGMLRSMDMIDREHYVFQWVKSEYDEEGFTIGRTSDRRIYTDLEGETHTVDLCSGYLACGLDYRFLSDGNCDGKGNTYAMISSKREGETAGIFFFDRDGNRILEYRGEQLQSVKEPLRTGEGDLIFPVWDSRNRRMEYLWADTEAGEMRTLAVEENGDNDIFQIYGMQGNDIYYNRSNREIIRWDVESGQRTKILDLPKNGLVAGVQIRMAFGEEGDHPLLYVLDTEYGKDWLAVLTDQEATDRETIRIADLVKSADPTMNAVRDSVSLVSGSNRAVFYTYEQAVSEEARTRLFAEWSGGNGPDILYVSLEDMRMLEEKGALLDLRELLPETLLSEILPGALELGTVDGKLVGFPATVLAETLMVSRDTWPEESWSLEDIIGLMENGALEGGIYYHNSYYYPLATMKVLVKYSLADSFLIDWENRKSHFDDERFVKLLELTRENKNDGPVETDTRLKGGKRIAWLNVGYSIQNDLLFDVDREQENGYYIGFPTSDGSCGNYLQTEGVVVVNSAVKDQEAVRAFLEVLSNGRTTGLRTGVRGEDSSSIRKDESTGKMMWWGREEAGVFADGTTSIDRANLFLKSCRAEPTTYPRLLQIIEEELNDMYDLNREPAETARIIQNRVQLYLNEEG